MSGNISKKRLAAFDKQLGQCYYCRHPMWLTNRKEFANKYNISELEADRFRCTAEHLLARCDGGKDDSKNIVAACYFCNNSRHRKKVPLEPDNYKLYVIRRLKKRKWHPKKMRRLMSSTA
jgi:hypothetical protein